MSEQNVRAQRPHFMYKVSESAQKLKRRRNGWLFIKIDMRSQEQKANFPFRLAYIKSIYTVLAHRINLFFCLTTITEANSLTYGQDITYALPYCCKKYQICLEIITGNKQPPVQQSENKVIFEGRYTGEREEAGVWWRSLHRHGC